MCRTPTSLRSGLGGFVKAHRRVRTLRYASNANVMDNRLKRTVSVRLSRNDSVRLPDRAAFVAGPIQGFIGDLCPELPRCRFMRVPFGVTCYPWHFIGSYNKQRYGSDLLERCNEGGEVACFRSRQVHVRHFRMWGEQIQRDFAGPEVRQPCNSSERGRLIRRWALLRR